ncbi:hypothetical protein M885DRAFT_616172 [Pelagophyceae sp. CCMP2097]|nr:hypothetical protein M885DRAFT_616172 [Pelagophyceae sp. CCMP2097]
MAANGGERWRVVFNGTVVASSRRCLTANARIYVPIEDCVAECFEASVWFHLVCRGARATDVAWCYPTPETHTHVRDCLTFKSPKVTLVAW